MMHDTWVCIDPRCDGETFMTKTVPPGNEPLCTVCGGPTKKK